MVELAPPEQIEPVSPPTLSGLGRDLGLPIPTGHAARSAAALAERRRLGEQQARTQEEIASELRTEATDLTEMQKRQAAQRAAAKSPPLALPTPPSAAGRAFLEPGQSLLGQIQNIILAIGQLGMQAKGLRGSAIGSLAALKGMAEGWAVGDAERVRREYAEWKAKSDTLVQEHRARREAYADLLTDGRQAMEERLQLIRLRAEAEGHRARADAARLGSIKDILDQLRHDEAIELSISQHQATTARWMAEQSRLERAFAATQAQRAKSNEFRERALAESTKTREALLRKTTLKELEPFQKAGKLADGLNELEKIYSTLEREHPELAPASGELFDAWGARIARALRPGDTSLFQLKMLWNQVIVGLLERGWSDEKGIRALAVFQSQINVQDQMPPPEALHGVMRSIRGLVRKGIDRDLKARESLGASKEELALARMFTETLRDPVESELMDELRSQFRE